MTPLGANETSALDSTLLFYRDSTDAPTAVAFTYTAAPNTPLRSYILAYSPNVWDYLQVYISALPDKGTLQQADGTPITSVPTRIISPKFEFIFIPISGENGAPYTNFSYFVVSKGAGNSSIITSIINVPADAQPYASPQVGFNYWSHFTNSDSSRLFTYNVIDPDSPSANLSVVYATKGATIRMIDCCGNPVNTLNPYPITSGLNGQTIVPRTSLEVEYFYIQDDKGNVSPMSYYIMAGGSPSNTAPTPVLIGSYTAERGLPLPINLGIRDRDYNQNFTVNVTVSMVGNGLLVDENNNTLSATSFMLYKFQNGVIFIFLLFFCFIFNFFFFFTV